MFDNYNCLDCPIPLYGNNVTSLIMCHFSIPQPWSPQQHGITKIYHTILEYSKHSYVRNAMNIYLHISYQPHWFCGCLFSHPQMIWCRFRLGSPNLNLKCFVITLTLKPPSSNTPFIVLFLIRTWITAI